MIRVAVCLPTHNGAPFLLEQLRSLARQTRLPDQLIICDDLSTDSTVEIAREFAGSAPFEVQVHVNTENLGYSRNFGQAIGLADADLIFPCDQDDVWHATKIERFEAAFAQNAGAGLVFANANVVGADLTPLGYTLWDTVDFTRGDRARFESGGDLARLVKHCFVAGATLAFRGALQPLVLPICERWVYDAWIALLAASVSEVVMIDQPLNDYRQHAAQALGGARKGLWQRYREARRGFSAEYFLRLAADFEAVTERLRACPDFQQRKRAVPMLEAKARHYRARARMRQNLLMRWPLVLGEALSGRYARLARGWKTAIMDLFV